MIETNWKSRWGRFSGVKNESQNTEGFLPSWSCISTSLNRVQQWPGRPGINPRCYILTLDRAVNQRCTCVNKRKKWKQTCVMKEYRQTPAAVEWVGHRRASQLADWECLTESNSPQRPLVEQLQPRYGRSAKWVLEDNTACYGQEKKLGQYSSLSQSLPISHTPQKHQPFQE